MRSNQAFGVFLVIIAFVVLMPLGTPTATAIFMMVVGFQLAVGHLYAKHDK